MENEGPGLVGCVIWLAIAGLMLASFWKIFVKAGKPGWAGIVPIYNLFVLLEIVGKPWWWLLLFLIPCVGFVVSIFLAIAVAKAFGQGVGFAIGLILVPVVFYPILAFGSAAYRGPTEEWGS